MYVLDVIPIAKAVGRETLTYFTSERVSSGMLVSVPLRARKIPAIVTAVEDVRGAKSRIRSLEHELRRIESLEAARFLLPSFIAAATKTARLAATTTGSVIFDLIPKPVLEHAREISGAPTKNANVLFPFASSATVTGTMLAPPEPEIVQAPEDERMAVYRRLIREALVKEESVMVLAPTVYLARRLARTLSKGIEQYSILIHGEIKPRSSFVSLWRRALEEPHPLLIVGTGSALSLPRRDCAVYILEEEGSRSYKHLARPFLDIRSATEEVCRAARARFVLGSALLRAETLYRAESGEAHALVPPTLRPLTAARMVLVDMAKKKNAPPQGRASASRRAMLSEEAEALIHRSTEAEERVLIFTARRGLAPTIVCGDCERVVLCRRCSAAVVLHSAPRRNVFLPRNFNSEAEEGGPGKPEYSPWRKAPTSKVSERNFAGGAGNRGFPENREPSEARPLFRCHRCSLERDAHETCVNCGGWKLVALGVGTEIVANAVRARVPEVPITRVDGDSTPSAPKAEKAVRTFLDSRAGILISTEMTLPYLTDDIEHIVVASLDSLLALPDFRMNERVFHLLLTLRSRALKTFLIQTRSPGHRLFSQALSGHTSDFIREELAERKRFGYPPFTTLVKISRAGAREALIKDMEHIKTMLAAYTPVIYPAPTNTPRGNTQMHALLKIPRALWPDEALLGLLSTLSPTFAIDVNPESIL